jgi:hypothetical protein
MAKVWVALFFSITLGAFGQIFMKEAMKGAGPVPVHEDIGVLFRYFAGAILSPQMLFAVASYSVSFILWLALLSVADLSLIRPLMSVGYLITLVYGYYAGESMSAERIIGTILIIAGLFFLVKSGLRPS